MKKIIIMLLFTNIVSAMQYDDWDSNLARLKNYLGKPNYLPGASYFIIHGLNSCEKYWVKSDRMLTGNCPEHTPHGTGDSTYDTSVYEELKKDAKVVTFYDRDDKPLYEKPDLEREQKKFLIKTSLYGTIGSKAFAQQYDKLDPQAKPIAARATVYGPKLTEIKSLLRRLDEWCCPYISFFDGKDRLIFKMPLEGYWGSEQLSENEQEKVSQYVELAAHFSIKDERDKKGCCGCCVLV